MRGLFPAIFPEMKAQHKALATHRRRLKRRGIARVEVRVPKEDAALLRQLAKVLSDPARAPRMRSTLRQDLRHGSRMAFKDFLAQAPLEGIDLERDRDTGRDIEF